MHKPLVVLWIALSLGVFALQACSREPLAPNVVLVSLDTVRGDHLSLSGYDRNTTPALRAFAQRGAVFENAYSQAPSTVPTHASLFTGRFPFQHQTYVHGNRLRDGELTLAEYLSGQGYRTFALTSSVRFVEKSGFDQGFDVYETFHHLDKNARSASVNARARALASQPSDRPYFAFLHYFDAHGPYAPPEPYRSLWHPTRTDPKPEDTVEFMLAHRHPGQALDDEQVAYLRALYDGSLRYLDRGLAELFESLPKANGRPILWVITADHGEAFKEHGALLHSIYLHEEMIRIPFVIVMPGTVREGRRIATPVQSVDVFPTLVDLLDLPLPAGLAGRSLAALALGVGNADDARVARAEAEVQDLVLVEAAASWGVIGTLPSGRFKWVTGRETGLYRLDVDPRADHDVSDAYEEERAALLRAADASGLRGALLDRAKLRIEHRPELEDDPWMIEQLRALGYVEELTPGR